MRFISCSNIALCLLPAKKKLKRKIVQGQVLRMNKEELQQIFKDLRGSSFQTGLIKIHQPDQFEMCAQTLIDRWKHGLKKQVICIKF